jgi:hypothetical protein
VTASSCVMRSLGIAVWRLRRRCGIDLMDARRVYALPRTGFHREWGHEWVSSKAVRPLLRLPVGPEDFPLRNAVIRLSSPEEFRRVSHHLRIAKRERAATMRGSILPFVRR